MNLKKKLKRWYYRFRNSDPVKNCPVYLSEGCSLVDGPFCPFPNCPVVSEYLGESFISCVECAYQDYCSSEQFGLGCYKGCKIPQEEAVRQVKGSKKYKVLFADLDGTLIDTVSGETFPKGIWDMKFRLDVLDKIKELNPEFLLIVTNQGGIEKGFVDENEFQCKSEYVSRAIREYCGCEVHSMYCTSNDKDNKYRKPNVGMLEILCADYVGDDFKCIKSHSLMIGDASGKPGQFSDSDMKCAENFGIDYLDVEDFLQTIFKEETK